MTEKIIRKISAIFIFVFFLMIAIPLVFTNLEDGAVSIAENRTLRSKPDLILEDGSLNFHYISEFENWFNDNVGLRPQLVLLNAKLQYYIFDQLSNSTDYYLGSNGELNYATAEMIKSYSHVDLLTERELGEIADAFQYVNDYLENQGISFYYFQCWDKHSIYPEYFMKSINQYGTESMTDQVIHTLQTYTTVDVISPKEMLIDEKGNCNTYSVWGDATHWTQRGAYLSYRMLMNKINMRVGNKYKILEESNYDISITDQGSTIFGGIHKADMEENFEILDAKAYLTDEPPLYLSEWQSQSRTIFRNESVDNNDTILIIGDSYFDTYLVDDIAESFNETVLIWGDYINNMQEMIEYYHPTIIICENAERCKRFGAMVSLSKQLQISQGTEKCLN